MADDVLERRGRGRALGYRALAYRWGAGRGLVKSYTNLSAWYFALAPGGISKGVVVGRETRTANHIYADSTLEACNVEGATTPPERLRRDK